MKAVNSARTQSPKYSSVDIRCELKSRHPRPRNLKAEDRCLAELAAEMARNPRNMLQKLVEVAIEYCNADTAGISLLETQNGTEVFRWEALAGVFADQRNNTMPRDASPCGVTIDEDSTQLMYLAERDFPALTADPPFVEALLIPFHVNDKPIGTVWVVLHTPDREFDAEDERFITALGQFASAAWQLWKSLEQVENANHLKDDFLAMVSHELRTPLGVVMNASKLLSSQKLTREEIASTVASIDRNVRLQKRILDDLIHLSRWGTATMELEIADTDLTMVITAAMEMVVPDAEARNITISLMIDIPPTIQADAARIQQVIANLLVNAVKFTPKNGAIVVAMTATETEVVIKVMDNGIGISADFLPFVFEKFRQKEIGKGEGGLGLGLAIARKLIEAHGGKITAASEGLNRGSAFSISLPLIKPATK